MITWKMNKLSYKNIRKQIGFLEFSGKLNYKKPYRHGERTQLRTCVNKDMKESVKSLYLLVPNTASQFTSSGQKWQLEEQPSRQWQPLAIYGTKWSYSVKVSVAFGGTRILPLVLWEGTFRNFFRKQLGQETVRLLCRVTLKSILLFMSRMCIPVYYTKQNIVYLL